MATTIASIIQPRRLSASGESPATNGAFEEEYLPESDGKPMAETDRHRDQMQASLHELQQHFIDNPQVYVSGNIFVYYLDEDGKRQSVSPDILVVFGVEKKERRIYKIDTEGKAPDVVIELTSPSTKNEDLILKHYIYANLGVREYFLFDPFSDTIEPALCGFRLKGGEYVPVIGNTLYSEVLALELKAEKNQLRLYDPKTGERLLSPPEAEAARRKAEAGRREAEVARREAEAEAKKELAARQNAEAEITRLREELAKLQAQSS